MMVRRVKVRANERGLLYRRGRFVRVLEPGVTWMLGGVEVDLVDMRRRRVFVDAAPAQLKDGVPVGLEAMVSFRVTDPVKARDVDDAEWHVGNDARAALYRAAATVALAELTGSRARLEADALDRLSLEASTYGMRIEDLAVLEIRYPRWIRRQLKRVGTPGLK